MTGVHTIPDDKLDPEYLLDVKDAEAFAGFHILLPTKLFPGEALSYFRVTSEDLSRRVTIMYQNNLAVSETILPTDTLESILKADPNVFQKVTVRGQPGLLLAEGGNSISITWFENGIEYIVYGIYDGQPVDVWLSLAESLK